MTSTSLDAVQYTDELLELLKEAELDPKETCIAGSSCLAIKGLRKNSDIDLCVKPSDYIWLSRQFDREHITFGTQRYACIGMDPVTLIEDERYHETIQEFKFIRPELEYSVKLFHQRQKDLKDIALLSSYAISSNDWDWSLVTTTSQNMGYLKKIQIALRTGGPRFMLFLMCEEINK